MTLTLVLSLPAGPAPQRQSRGTEVSGGRCQQMLSPPPRCPPPHGLGSGWGTASLGDKGWCRVLTHVPRHILMVLGQSGSACWSRSAMGLGLIQGAVRVQGKVSNSGQHSVGEL